MPSRRASQTKETAPESIPSGAAHARRHPSPHHIGRYRRGNRSEGCGPDARAAARTHDAHSAARQTGRRTGRTCLPRYPRYGTRRPRGCPARRQWRVRDAAGIRPAWAGLLRPGEERRYFWRNGVRLPIDTVMPGPTSKAPKVLRLRSGNRVVFTAYPDNWATELRPAVLARDGHRCTLCGADRRLSVHHVRSLSRGGANDLSNLVTLCATRHEERHPYMRRVRRYIVGRRLRDPVGAAPGCNDSARGNRVRCGHSASRSAKPKKPAPSSASA
jgi:hypothetical protein